MKAENMKIKKWYMENYPQDELGKEISNITFYELFEILDRRKDVYPYLADDSVVRERVFAKLAEIAEVSYDYIYDQWLLCE